MPIDLIDKLRAELAESEQSANVAGGSEGLGILFKSLLCVTKELLNVCAALDLKSEELESYVDSIAATVDEFFEDEEEYEESLFSSP